MTFYSQRSMALFAIIAAPVAARYLASAWESWKSAPIGLWLADLQGKSANKPLPVRVTRIINGVIILLILLLIFSRAIMLTDPAKVKQDYPEAAVSWISRNKPQGQMFNSYNWGGYLIWDLQDYPVFIDGRADLYGDEIIGEWWQIVSASDEGFALIDQRDINFVLLEPGTPIVDALAEQGWSVLYQDDLSSLLGRLP